MALAVVLILLVAAIALAVEDPRKAMLVTVFLAPWSGLMVDVGIQVTAYLVALAGLVIATLLRMTQPGFRPRGIAAGGWLALMLGYAVLVSLLQLGFLPDFKSEGGALRGPTARAIIQMLLFLFAFAPVLLYPSFARSSRDALLLARVYLLSVTILAIIGWGQLAIWFVIGSNPLPINIVNVVLGGGNAEGREGIFGVGALMIYRMNSLALEPRNLGVALAVSLLLIQSQALAGMGSRFGRLAALWLFLLLSMLATFSTSAAALWLLGTAAMLPACWLFGIKSQLSARTIIIGVVAVLGPLVIGTLAAEANGIPVTDIIAQRTIERLSNDGAVEDFDLAIYDFYKVHPGAAIAGVGLGNIHLYAGPYLDPLYALYAQNSVFNAKTQFLKFISEIGIIGFALVLLWFARLLALAAAVARQAGDLAPIVPAAAGIFVAFLASAQISWEFFSLAASLTIVASLAARTPQPARPAGQLAVA